LEFTRYPAAEDDPPLIDEPAGAVAEDPADSPLETELHFELKGMLPVAGEGAAELLAAIAAEFQQPPRDREGGGK